ncbi:sensor histidine kinase [Niameybacter massiliensis]|uniref:sensor histidine kinase n=1 Tax=Niameybacter massiliensis TaxID=1658108 RepID=UPI0006B69BEA|nr:GHKL domain-containing protein [Niameybacter massiliensis]
MNTLEIILKVITFVTCIIYFVIMINATSLILKKRTNKYITSIVILISSIIFVSVNNTYIPGYIVYIITYIHMIIFFALLFDGRKKDILFASGNIVLHLCGIGLIAFCFMAGCLRIEVGEILKNTIFNYLYVIMKLGISIVIAVIFIIRYKKLQDIWLSKFSINIIYKIQTLLNILIIVYGAYYSLAIETERYEWGMIIILMLFIYYITIQYTKTYDFYIDTQVKNILLENQISKQVSYYEIQKEHINKLRKFKHDYKHMIEGISYLIIKEDIKGLKRFVEEMDVEMRAIIDDYKEYSNHSLLQAILWDAQERIKKLEIQFDAYIYIPKGAQLTDLEVCRVFLNIIENCIEACEKAPDIERRFINIKTINTKEGVVIKVENTLNERLIIRNNHFITTKDDPFEHGLGIKNIQEIIEKHKGLLNIKTDQKNKKFILQIYLPHTLD